MYSRIHEGVWKSLKRKDLSLLGREVFIYLFSCPHHNIIGLYYLPLDYIATDLNEPLPNIKATVTELLDKGLITYDYDSEIILVKGFLEHNPLVNNNAVKSAIAKTKEIPNTPIFNDFITVLERLPNRYETLIGTVRQRLAIQNTESRKQNTERQKEESNSSCCSNSACAKEMSPEEEAISRVTTYYLDKINAAPSSISCAELLEYIPILGPDVVIKAMSLAVDENKRHWSYIRGILQNWTKLGVKTLDDVQRIQNERDEAKTAQAGTSNNGKRGFNYDQSFKEGESL